MQLTIPDFALVVLIGPSGSGKSNFAARHFKPTEILSSDRCRGWVADDETDQGATTDAFEVLQFIAGKRLSGRRLTVVDATNVRPEDRKLWIDLARRYHALPAAIVFDVPAEVCIARNRDRPDRQFGGRVVRSQLRLMQRSQRGLHREGFRHVFALSGTDAVEGAAVVREPLYTDRRGDRGPFDIIGDVHGCFAELCLLLDRLGYQCQQRDGRSIYIHPEGRRAVFVGDLVDRGPAVTEVLRLTIDMVASGAALCVAGNHEARLLRKLNGRDVKTTHGLAQSLEQIDALPSEERAAFIGEARGFLDGLRSHYWLDGGRLVVAHAGLKEEMHGRGSAAVRSFALYGETTGETDEFGLPVRFDWAARYRGEAIVVYGHVPTPVAEWVNRTICVDTGCVFGGRLTALRYPELDLVEVPAARTYCEPTRPLGAVAMQRTAQQAADTMLDIEDILGKRTIETPLLGHIRVESDHAAAALEVIGRFAVDPRWLVYLPPTMSPAETSRRPDLLEHPEDAFAYFARAGVATVIVQEKHMGSRAVIAVTRGEAAAQRRFAVGDGRIGRIWTRTGRPFFAEDALEQGVLERLAAALSASGFWDRLDTDWVCFDAELMPWSVKAQPLIAEQYRPVGAASCAATEAAADLAAAAGARGIDVAALCERLQLRAANAAAFVETYRRFAGDVAGIDDLRLALFHVLASEGAVHTDRSHAWHLSAADAIGGADPQLFVPTRHRLVDLGDETARQAAIAWWEELTEKGGEGVVVKPLAFVARGPGGLVQPALKCRGREYLRLVYGPDYTMPAHLERLRQRVLGRKRALALREFALGLEGLQRFTRREPLRRVHECVFAILALESEPVDARL